MIKYNSKKKKIKKIKLRPWFFYTIVISLILIIIINCYTLYNWNKDNKEIKKIKEEIEETIVPKEINDKGENINPPSNEDSDYWYYINMPFYSVDFTELQQKNNDTIAFIYMKNTNINYPIVQSTDNEYYLNHAFDKSKNDAGWVYMDYRNNKHFTNDNTIIYGHGRLNKTVFGTLKNTLTKKWQSNKDNYLIYISTPSKNLIYQIFSIYTIESESYYITTDFFSKSEKIKWLNTMKERNIAPISTEVNENDTILTLSTCQNNNGGRIVVQAKLIKQQKKET